MASLFYRLASHVGGGFHPSGTELWRRRIAGQPLVVPVAFWWLSLIGGLMLLAYFLRRGDPVGVVGQAFGVTVYVRNLIFIRRREDLLPAEASVAVADPGPHRGPAPEDPRAADG